MALLTSDTFDRLDSTSLGNTDGVGILDPTPWLGNPEVADIISNTAQLGGSATLNIGITGYTAVVINYIDTGISNIEILLKNNFGGSGVRHGIIFRYDDINNYWAFLALDGSTTKLYKKVAGTWTTVSGALNLGGVATGIIYKIKTSGSKIECTVNGISVFTVYDTAHISATKHGFLIGAGSLRDIEIWEGGLGLPEILQIGPTEGPASGGTVVTIAGHNFTGVTAVKFGATAATSFTVVSDGYIEATSPAHAVGVTDIIVTNADGDNALVAADEFEFINPPPIVSSVIPTNGPPAGGTSVVITGAYFTDTTDVEFGTDPAFSFVVDNDGQITAVTDVHVPGVVPVIVTTPWGSNG